MDSVISYQQIEFLPASLSDNHSVYIIVTADFCLCHSPIPVLWLIIIIITIIIIIIPLPPPLVVIVIIMNNSL